MSHLARGPVSGTGIDGKGASERGAGDPIEDGTEKTRVEPAVMPTLHRPPPGCTFQWKALLPRPRANAVGRRRDGGCLCTGLTGATA